MKTSLVLFLLATHSSAFEFGLGAAAAKQAAKVVNKAMDNDIPNCTGDPPFSVTPLSLNDVMGMVPLGNLSPTPHTFPADHTYLYLKRTIPGDYTSPTVATNLYAPGTVTVTRVSSQVTTPPVGQVISDYAITLQPCKQVTVVFGHVAALAGPLTGLGGGGSCISYTTGGSNVVQCNHEVHVKVSAGTIIGTMGGNTRSVSLDFGVYDTRSHINFANPGRHYTNQYQTVCPADYYNTGDKATLYARYGSFDGATIRTTPPVCGTIDQDISGTAQGSWYRPGSPNSPEDPHMALVHDNVTPSTAVFSMGNSVSGLQGVFSFTPTHSGLIRREFSELTADGNVYCYDGFANLFNSIILLKMTDASNIQIEKQTAASCGSGPWTLTGASVAFSR